MFRSSRRCLILALALAGCATSSHSQRLDQAARLVAEGDTDPERLALAGFAAYFDPARQDSAAELFRRSLDQGETPLGHFGALLMAHRATDDRALATHALAVCELAPRAPLCAVASRMVGEAVGSSTALDTVIDERIGAVLGRHPTPEAARLLAEVRGDLARLRVDPPMLTRAYADAGGVQAASLWGPYSPYRNLDWETAFPPEKGDLSGPLRTSSFPNASLRVFAESRPGDLFYWAAAVEAPETGDYLLQLGTSRTAAVFLDGAKLLERRAIEGNPPLEQAREVTLDQGSHRLLIKFLRGMDDAPIDLYLTPVDGSPSRLSFGAARGKGLESSGSKAKGSELAFGTVAAITKALEPELGTSIAEAIGAFVLAGRDPEGTARAAQHLAKDPIGESAVALSWGGRMKLANPNVLPRLSRGLARPMFEKALERDPGNSDAALRLAALLRQEDQTPQANEVLTKALARNPASVDLRTALLQADEAKGASSLAETKARALLQDDPTLCQPLTSRYLLAQRRQQVSLQRELLPKLHGCSGAVALETAALQDAGKFDEARTLLERQAALDPSAITPRLKLVQFAVSRNRPDEAAGIYRSLQLAYPGNAWLLRNQAQMVGLTGDAQGARTLREAALKAEGDDLATRRALAYLDRTEVLKADAIDGDAVIRQYKKEAPRESGSGVYLLDASVMEAQKDGSLLERSHAIIKVTSQEGIAQHAEPKLPDGAEILTLRTIKADGRVLEPEELEGKETPSLPGVEIGDFIEYEYLNTYRAGSDGAFTTPQFTFPSDEGPVFRSSFLFRAPAGVAFTVDAHGMATPPTVRRGDWNEVKVERSNIPPFTPEGNGLPRELIGPFVQIGSQRTLEDQSNQLADLLLEQLRPTDAVRAWALQATRGKKGLAAVRALYDREMAEIVGPEGRLGSPEQTLADHRGSRLGLLKSGLDALGISSRFVQVRPFDTGPEPFLFPWSNLFNTMVLRVEAEGRVLFLSPSTRYAPFGRIEPELGDREAVLLPAVGERARMITTPPSPSDTRTVRIQLTAASDGTIEGRLSEQLEGFSAARVREPLKQMDPDQFQQVSEVAIAQTFDGATLTHAELQEVEGRPDALRIVMTFTAPGLSPVGTGQLSLSQGLYPFRLAAQYLKTQERKTLFVSEGAEEVDLACELRLPASYRVEQPQDVALQTPFGRYERKESSKPGLFRYTERLSIPLQYIPPKTFPEFAKFLTTIDETQTRERMFHPEP